MAPNEKKQNANRILPKGDVWVPDFAVYSKYLKNRRQSK